MKVVFCTILCSLLLGCAQSLIEPDRMRGGGDSDQEVLTIEGSGTVTFNQDGTWTATCKKDCKLIWITQAQANADRDAKMVEAAGDIAIRAMGAALP